MDRKELAMLVKDTIGSGECTKDTLLQLEEVKDARALGRVFSDLRFLGYYPIENTDTGFFGLMEEEDYENFIEEEKERKKEAAKNKKATTRSKIPPQVRYQTRLTKFNNSLAREQSARFKYQQKPENEILKLRWNITQFQLKISRIEYDTTLLEITKSEGYKSKEEASLKLANGMSKIEED